MTFKIIISYDGTEKDRFDRKYYCENHIPHVRKAWEPFGLLDIRPFFPGIGSDKKGAICIALCVFRDKAAMDAALGSSVTKELLDDIPNFTDLSIEMGVVAPMEN